MCILVPLGISEQIIYNPLTCISFFFVKLQIAGTGVLAIGLWLRYDPKTKSLFEGENSPYVFYTGQ